MGQKLMNNSQALKVYELAFEEAMELYWLLPQMLFEDEDVLGQKIVEASRLVCANLAEAWGQRRCGERFVAKLNEAEMGAAAVQTWLAFAMECGYVEMEVGQQHCDRYCQIVGAIGDLVKEPAWRVKVAA